MFESTKGYRCKWAGQDKFAMCRGKSRTIYDEMKGVLCCGIEGTCVSRDSLKTTDVRC